MSANLKKRVQLLMRMQICNTSADWDMSANLKYEYNF